MRRLARVLHQRSTIHQYSTTSWEKLVPKGKSNHHDDRVRWTVCPKTGNHIGSVSDVLNIMEKKMGFQYTIGFIESLRDSTIDRELTSVINRLTNDAREAEKYNRPFTGFKTTCILLKALLENGVSVNENTYGPILSYMINNRMTKDFVLLRNDLMMNNIDSSSRLSYYQMLLWIKEAAEDKIMELIKNADCSTTEHYLEALGISGRIEAITILLDAIDVQGVSTETGERTFRLLGRFSLELHAKKIIHKFQTNDYDEKYVSKLICIYAMNLETQLVNAVATLKRLHRELKVVTTQATYESVIQICTDSKEVSLAIRIVEIMFKEGLIIDVNVLNSMLVACHYSGYYDLVRDVYSMIDGEYTKPNQETLVKMINLFMKINDYAAARKLLEDSRRFNVSPTIEMYNAILGGYFAKGEFEKGWEFLNEMDDLSVKRNAETYERIISACKTGDDDDIVKYKREMQLSGVQPTKGIFEAFIKDFSARGDFENAKKVLLDKTVPAKSLNARYGQMDDAYAEYEEIKRTKQLVKPRTIQMLIQHTHAPNQCQRLIDMLDELCKYEDWDYSCASCIMYCVEHNYLKEALKLLSARVKRWPEKNKWLIGNIFDEVSHLIVNKLDSNKSDNASLEFGLKLFTLMMQEIKVRPSRRSLDFLLHSCYLRRHLKYLLDVWKMYPDSCRRYYIINLLCMYKSLLACGEPEKAKLLVEHVSGSAINKDINWIRKASEHHIWMPKITPLA